MRTMNAIRRLKNAVVVGAALAGLQACADFRPLYGTNGAGERNPAISELGDVDIPPPNSRAEQLIRNDLISSLSQPGREGAGRYLLTLSPTSDDFALVVERNTDVSRRSYRLNVAFSLRDNASGKTLYSGNTFSEVSHDQTTSEFANLQARTNAEERAALQVSRDIRTRLAVFFATRRRDRADADS